MTCEKCWRCKKVKTNVKLQACDVDDDDDEGRINFSMALSPKTTRTLNNKPT